MRRSKIQDVTADGMVVDILGGALSFSLKDVSRFCGNVWPFSQMSMSFLIFSYTQQRDLVSFYPFNEYTDGRLRVVCQI